MKYRLLTGQHREGKKGYTPGDIVESEKDLTATFGDEKFERVNLPVPPPLPVSKKDKTLAEKKEIDAKKLVAVHKGAGRWDVIRADTDEKINDKLLSREEAEKMAGIRK